VTPHDPEGEHRTRDLAMTERPDRPWTGKPVRGRRSPAVGCPPASGRGSPGRPWCARCLPAGHSGTRAGRRRERRDVGGAASARPISAVRRSSRPSPPFSAPPGPRPTAACVAISQPPFTPHGAGDRTGLGVESPPSLMRQTLGVSVVQRQRKRAPREKSSPRADKSWTSGAPAARHACPVRLTTLGGVHGVSGRFESAVATGIGGHPDTQ
jgi:hypothetical protein